MIVTRKLPVIALIIYTMVVTSMRTFRAPNDFAEAHWLLDYRFGFMKRAFVGEIVSLVSGYMAESITAQLISTLASAAFLIYCIVLLVLSMRIIQKSGWSTETVLVVLVFLSSPFIVMSAHLNGYYDNIIIILGIFSVVLLLKGKPWLGAWLYVPALLIHENTLLLGFAPFCLAWLLMNSRYQRVGLPALSFLPLLLPVCAFLAVTISQEMFVAQNFVELFTEHLSQFPFVHKFSQTTVPVWVARPFLLHYESQYAAFADRLSSISMYGLVLPSAFAILSFAVSAYRIQDFSIESLLLISFCFAPQVLHIIAWDTTRIWTYTIFCAFVALWIYSEIFPAHENSSANRLLCVAALIANAMVLVPLMDKQIEHFGLTTRLMLYAPVIIGSLALIFYRKGIPITERVSVQGIALSKLLYPAKYRGASAYASYKKADVPDDVRIFSMAKSKLLYALRKVIP